MTRVGWLADHYDPPGGAELTQAEFLAAAPEGAEVVLVRPDSLDLLADCEVAVVHNCVTYPAETVTALHGKRVVKYVHDAWPNGDPSLRQQLLDQATLIFTSPLHRQLFLSHIPDWAVVELVPPALPLHLFAEAALNRDVEVTAFQDAEPRKMNPRQGTCWLGSMNNPGKGVGLVTEWAERNGPVDFYGQGAYAPIETEKVRVKGPVAYADAPTTLARYERFIFLPTHTEPFGRGVVEAWAAGCDLVLNGNVGARHWVEENPEALETAGEDFWSIVLG